MYIKPNTPGLLRQLTQRRDSLTTLNAGGVRKFVFPSLQIWETVGDKEHFTTETLR